MKRIALAGALALSLGACVPNPEIATPNQVAVGIGAYNTAVGAGAVYLRRPLCPVNAPICRDQAMSQKVYTALKSGREARNRLLAQLRANQTVNLTALDALKAAYSVLTSIK